MFILGKKRNVGWDQGPLSPITSFGAYVIDFLPLSLSLSLCVYIYIYITVYNIYVHILLHIMYTYLLYE